MSMSMCMRVSEAHVHAPRRWQEVRCSPARETQRSVAGYQDRVGAGGGMARSAARQRGLGGTAGEGWVARRRGLGGCNPAGCWLLPCLLPCHWWKRLVNWRHRAFELPPVHSAALPHSIGVVLHYESCSYTGWRRKFEEMAKATK